MLLYAGLHFAYQISLKMLILEGNHMAEYPPAEHGPQLMEVSYNRLALGTAFICVIERDLCLARCIGFWFDGYRGRAKKRCCASPVS